jgi:hypothetical protein
MLYTSMRKAHGGALLNARTCIELYTSMRKAHGGALLNARTCIELYTTMHTAVAVCIHHETTSYQKSNLLS